MTDTDDYPDATALTRAQYDPDDDYEPYPEPDPVVDEWPESWTPTQCELWEQAIWMGGDTVYELLESDAARYWWRRCYRPKKRDVGTGVMMETDRVTFGTPEDYIVEHVESVLTPMGNITSTMMRRIGSYDISKAVLEAVVDDIVQAKVQLMGPTRRRRLCAKYDRVAQLYGIDNTEQQEAE